MSPNKNEIHIDGFCAPEFEDVKHAFAENFLINHEIGASVSVIHQGKTVVDLWGGYKDAKRAKLWQKDTLCCVMSVTKGIASLAVLSLADKQLIDLDKPVAHYWPEFAGGGKQDITVRCVLAQLAGLPVVDAAPPGSLYEPGVIEKALETQKPLWPAGTTPCYHSFTHGPLCQELVKRVTGKTLGAYLKEDLFGPLGIEFYLSMNDDQLARCADISVAPKVPTLEKMEEKGSLLERAWRPMPKSENFFQEAKFRKTEFASGNGHSNARNLAKIYDALLSTQNNSHSILSRAVLDDAITEQWNNVEVITNRHFRYGTGFMLNNPYFTTGPNPESFGHPGLGGAIAFGDPVDGISFGYCCNLVHPIEDSGPCASALIDAVYQSI